MRIGNIDWNKDEINIIQHKTGKPMSIPLTPDIGNTLSDYLLNERVKTDCDYIFLSTIPPFGRLSSSGSIRSTMGKVLKEADIYKTECGVRMSRHSFASKMVREDVPLDIVSEALGHRDK